MKFHADEHVADAVVLGLQQRGFDATTTSDAGLIGAADEKQLAYCRRHGRVMITHDADMLRLAAVGTPHAEPRILPQSKIQGRQVPLRASQSSRMGLGGRDYKSGRISVSW